MQRVIRPEPVQDRLLTSVMRVGIPTFGTTISARMRKSDAPLRDWVFCGVVPAAVTLMRRNLPAPTSTTFTTPRCQTGSWADTSDALNGAPNAQFAVCSACSALCATGCGFPPSVNRSVIAAMLPSTREAVTAAFCAPAGEMGCNPVNSFYSLASTTIGGFPVTGLCVQGSTSNCPANTYVAIQPYVCMYQLPC
jgi:hypothetical protein